MVSVNHDLAASMEFDTVALVDDGRVVEKGPPRELAAVQDGQFGRMSLKRYSSAAGVEGDGMVRALLSARFFRKFWKVNLQVSVTVSGYR